MERHVMTFDEIDAHLTEGWLLCCETNALKKFVELPSGKLVAHWIMLDDDCVNQFCEAEMLS